MSTLKDIAIILPEKWTVNLSTELEVEPCPLTNSQDLQACVVLQSIRLQDGQTVVV